MPSSYPHGRTDELEEDLRADKEYSEKWTLRGFMRVCEGLIIKWQEGMTRWSAEARGRIQRQNQTSPRDNHFKSVCKTWTLNPELVKTDLNFKYRS